MQPIQLIDARSRFDVRTYGLGLLLAVLVFAGALFAAQIMDLESQVLGLVILLVLLVTAFFAFHDLSNAVILWFFALTCIARYTQLNLPGIPDMSGPRFMLVLMWGVLAVQVAQRRRHLRPLGRVELWMLVFVAVHLASMIHHENLFHTQHRASPVTMLVTSVIFPFTIYYLVAAACSGDRAVRKLLTAFAVLQVYLVLTAIFEHFRIKWLVFPPDILDPTAGGGRWYGARVRGPYLHSPLFGAMMGMGFFILLHLYNYTRSKWRWVMLLGLLATPLACFYTLTRQVWLGLLLPMVLGAFFSRRQRAVLALLLLAGLTFAFVAGWEAIGDPEIVRERTTDQSTGEARIALLVGGAQMFLDRPFFGFGLQNWSEYWESYRRRLTADHWMFGEIDPVIVRQTGTHNTFLRVAVELGLLGLLPFLLIFWSIFQSSLRLYRRSAPTGLTGRELVVAFWQLSIAFLVCINFVDPSFQEFLPGFFFAMAAVTVRRAEIGAGAPPASWEAPVSFGGGRA